MFVTVKVCSEGNTLLHWTICKTQNTATFESLYAELVNTEPDIESYDTIKSVQVGANKTGLSKLKVPFSQECKEIFVSFGYFVIFEVRQKNVVVVGGADDVLVLEPDGDGDGGRGSQHAQPNAFDILMGSPARQVRGRIPAEKPLHGHPNRSRLHNDIVKLLHNIWDDGILGVNANDGKSFVDALHAVLWYVDGHHATLADRVKIPDMFRKFEGYNIPETHKHRKRTVDNLSATKLRELVGNLMTFTTRSWIKRDEWLSLRVAVDDLLQALTTYASYLREKAMRMREHHARTILKENNYTMKVLPINNFPLIKFTTLWNKVKDHDSFIDTSAYVPEDRMQRRRFLQDMEMGFPSKVVHVTYSYGGNIQDYNFLWMAKDTEEETLLHSTAIMDDIKRDMPVYHSRALKKQFIQRFGKFTNNTPRYILRGIYQELTKDASGFSNLTEQELESRMMIALDAEDPDILVDLRGLNGEGADRYAVFWEHMAKYIEEVSGVHHRRQSTVQFMAVALSTRDLIDQVTKLCPPETPIPSDTWVRYQFCPRNPNSKEGKKHTQRFKVKYMVQQRLLRASHTDAHYCSAYFKYLREFAITHKKSVTFVSLDDKHRIKVGEPGFPVAAVERGKEVIVSVDSTIKVADHDFTKASIIPSGQLIVNVPSSIEESFYGGSVHIGLKDAAFEPSSGMRHSAELYKTLTVNGDQDKTVLILYTDGGPDHNCTFLNNQVALIALHLMLDMDLTIAMRTAPHQSWKNMVERVFSTVNIRLQAVGMMRAGGNLELENALKNVSNLASVRKAVVGNDVDMREEYAESMEPCKELLKDVIQRLEWTGKKIEVFESATEQAVTNMWDALTSVDATLEQRSLQKKDLKNFPGLQGFMAHCCTQRSYSFSISKCGEEGCHICLPVRMDIEDFKQIHKLPDPVPTTNEDDDDEHYKSFSDLYGKVSTTEEHLPSLKNADKRRGSLPFSASAQHVRNAGNIVVQCEECAMWRVVYSKKKLGLREHRILQDLLESTSYSCGVSLRDFDLPELLHGHIIELQAHRCRDLVETLYYSSEVSDVICIYCSALTQPEWNVKEATFYPRCDECENKLKIKIKGKGKPKPTT